MRFVDNMNSLKKYLRLILMLFIASLISCEKSENTMPIEGIWVEVSAKSDTIKFIQFGSHPAFELSRGLEMRNGYWLPKYGAGIYNYELKDDSIALNNTLSSLGGFLSYYFQKPCCDSFEIGNFYSQTISPNELITFSKIE